MVPFQLHRSTPSLRRPFFQRDKAVADRDLLAIERDQAVRDLDAALRALEKIAAEHAALVLGHEQAVRDLESVVANANNSIQQRDTRGANATGAADAKVATYAFDGFHLPIDLMLMTGGDPDTFAEISAGHIENLKHYLGLDPGFTLLEIGCGIGRDAIPLTKVLSGDQGGRYVGIDIIRKSIDWCIANIQAKYPNFIFHHMDISDQLHNSAGMDDTRSRYIPVPNRHVDRIVVQSILTHMLRAEVEHYLAEFAWVIKPSARACVTVFRYDDAVPERARATNLTPFDLRFEHEVEPGCRINDIKHPTGAVAFTPALINQLIIKHGLRQARAPLKGAWSGFYPDPQDGQDVLILTTA